VNFDELVVFTTLLILVSLFWISFEIRLLLRDRLQGKGKTGIDRRTRLYNVIGITVGIVGASFRTTVETHADQRVVERGPYSGLMLMGLGYGITFQNRLSLAFAVVPTLLALLYRIHIEEPVLVASLGPAYEEYRKKTKRLIPWIW
jgi:hypothetical protein